MLTYSDMISFEQVGCDIAVFTLISLIANLGTFAIHVLIFSLQMISRTLCHTITRDMAIMAACITILSAPWPTTTTWASSMRSTSVTTIWRRSSLNSRNSSKWRWKSTGECRSGTKEAINQENLTWPLPATEPEQSELYLWAVQIKK